ncbi:MAG: iron-containing alcohol dehydrogenase [Chloroflexi bacterium]|nr:iron-containing alcohol dehydrogenase [Chloroflexota bacterium]
MKFKFDYVTPGREIIFGVGSLDRLSDVVERFHWQRLLLCASGSSRRSGRIESIEKMLGTRLVAIYGEVQAHVPDFQVDRVVALAEQSDIDAVIGLGGGSAVGMAKAVSFAFEEKTESKSPRVVLPTAQPRIPIIAIPTTYAGSEMTSVYGITHHENETARKITVQDPRIAPQVVLYDPLLTLDLPPDLTASTGINTLAHCVEAVYSITRNPLSTAAALEGINHIARTLPRCYARGDDLQARTEMLVGSYLAGTALANVATGLHHGLCHVLGGTLGISHGVANAIILPHAIRYNADACVHELALVAKRMGITDDDFDDVQLAAQAATQVSELIAEMNLPRHLREVGVKENDLTRVAELAAASRTVMNNPKPIDQDRLTVLLQAAW